MKPAEWNVMTSEERKKTAMDLYRSKRGWFLMGQALCFASEAMKKVPEEQREVSNIEDIEMLQELFFPYHLLRSLEEATRGQRTPPPMGRDTL